jgi:hypothetical protein
VNNSFAKLQSCAIVAPGVVHTKKGNAMETLYRELDEHQDRLENEDMRRGWFYMLSCVALGSVGLLILAAIALIPKLLG